MQADVSIKNASISQNKAKNIGVLDVIESRIDLSSSSIFNNFVNQSNSVFSFTQSGKENANKIENV